MIRRISIVLCAAALLVAVSAVDTQAARYRGSSHRSLRAQRPSATQRAAKSVYPRVRQVDGRTLWDLGKQNGQWPQLP